MSQEKDATCEDRLAEANRQLEVLRGELARLNNTVRYLQEQLQPKEG
jgi:hypothetical protein